MRRFTSSHYENFNILILKLPQRNQYIKSAEPLDSFFFFQSHSEKMTEELPKSLDL